MRHQAIQEMFSYWNELRQTRIAPDRLEVDPTAIRNVLGHTFMIEADSANPFQIRLSGTRFNALWMRELKGTSFLDLWGTDAPNVSAALWTVMDGACPVLAEASAAPPDYPQESMEMLLLPLRHVGGTHARILGACAQSSYPSWLGLISVERLRLQSLKIISQSAPAQILPIAHPKIDRGVHVRRSRFRLYRGGLDAPAAQKSAL